MMFASYIAPAWFLNEPSIEREQRRQNPQHLKLNWFSRLRFKMPALKFSCTLLSLSLSTALIPGEKCSPVALRLAEPWSTAGLECLAATLATPFRDGERVWRADTLFWSALLMPTSREERQDYTNMQTSVKRQTCSGHQVSWATMLLTVQKV